MSMYYVYVLRSRNDGRLYVGQTADLKRRLAQHQRGEVTTTKRMLPLDLVYYEGSLSEISSILRERQLKTGFGRRYLKNRLEV